MPFIKGYTPFNKGKKLSILHKQHIKESLLRTFAPRRLNRINKICSVCKIDKPISEFSKRQNRNSIDSRCKECNLKRFKDYKLKNREKYLILKRIATAKRRLNPNYKIAEYKWRKNHYKKSILTYLLKKCEKYKNWRYEIIKRDNFQCQNCKDKNSRLIVHHLYSFDKIYKSFLDNNHNLSPLKDIPSLFKLSQNYHFFWNLDNGITLCNECHKKIHYALKH